MVYGQRLCGDGFRPDFQAQALQVGSCLTQNTHDVVCRVHRERGDGVGGKVGLGERGGKLNRFERRHVRQLGQSRWKVLEVALRDLARLEVALVRLGLEDGERLEGGEEGAHRKFGFYVHREGIMQRKARNAVVRRNMKPFTVEKDSFGGLEIRREDAKFRQILQRAQQEPNLGEARIRGRLQFLEAMDMDSDGREVDIRCNTPHNSRTACRVKAAQ